ncbi:hypothetical protein BKA80DRAFT_44675 [Phyllosticta citrichinensis]
MRATLEVSGRKRRQINCVCKQTWRQAVECMSRPGKIPGDRLTVFCRKRDAPRNPHADISSSSGRGRPSAGGAEEGRARGRRARYDRIKWVEGGRVDAWAKAATKKGCELDHEDDEEEQYCGCGGEGGCGYAGPLATSGQAEREIDGTRMSLCVWSAPLVEKGSVTWKVRMFVRPKLEDFKVPRGCHGRSVAGKGRTKTRLLVALCDAKRPMPFQDFAPVML